MKGIDVLLVVVVYCKVVVMVVVVDEVSSESRCVLVMCDSDIFLMV